MGKRFWTIRAAKDDPKVGEVLLYGYISNTSWWDDDITPKQFKKDLDALGDVDIIHVFINSGGGDVFAAQAIYSMLRRHKASKNVYIDGLAASAASFVAMVGDTVTMPQNAMIMIHNPWSIALGSSAEFRKIADDLDKIREPMIATYAAKTGLSDEEIAAYLDAETWFTADEAKEAGFADVVEELKAVAASIEGNTLTINGQQVDLSAYRAFPAEKVAASVGLTETTTTIDGEVDATSTTITVADAVQEPAEAPAADEPEVDEAAPAEDEKQARLRLLRLRARV